MIESLIDLDQELKTRKSRLYFFQGIAKNMVEKLVKSEAINAVFVNRGYSADKAVELDKQVRSTATQ